MPSGPRTWSCTTWRGFSDHAAPSRCAGGRTRKHDAWFDNKHGRLARPLRAPVALCSSSFFWVHLRYHQSGIPCCIHRLHLASRAADHQAWRIRPRGDVGLLMLAFTLTDTSTVIWVYLNTVRLDQIPSGSPIHINPRPTAAAPAVAFVREIRAPPHRGACVCSPSRCRRAQPQQTPPRLAPSMYRNMRQTYACSANPWILRQIGV